MYTLGINFKEEENLFGYGDFDFPDCQMISFTENDFLQRVQKADGILLKETGEHSIEKICYMIIELRKKCNPLIWVLSKKASLIQKIIYLELGADGTFTDMNAPEEIYLVIKQSLNRYRKSKKETEVKAESGITLNERNLSIQGDKEELEVILTRLEYQLLKLFLENESVVLTYQQLYEEIWGYPYENDRYRIANLVFHLRKKLKQAGKDPEAIRTVRAQGYMLGKKELEKPKRSVRLKG